MKIFLNGKEINKTLITVNDGLNYGRFSNLTNSSINDFELQLDHAEFINTIEEEYNQLRDEIKKDDIAYNDSSPFSQTAYTSLANLFKYEADLKSIIFVSICIILWSFPLSACTVFNKSSRDRALFGNVENEASHYVAELHFVPPDKSQGYYGHFYIKYNGNIGGGMNDQGLCFDVAGLPSHDFITAGKAPRDLMAYLLEDCATLQDALDFFKSYYWVGHRVNHLMVMDKTGASAIVEHIGNVVYIYKKDADGQVMTNFAIANPEIRFGDYPCDRFNTATDMLESLAITVDNFQKIAKKVAHAYYPALYANIYDPNSLDIHFFNANHPGDYRTSFNLLEEFKLGSHHYILKNNQILLDVAETGHRMFTISDNAPNPFQNETSFSLTLVDNAEIIISIFDMHGRKVDVLENDSKHPGSFTYTWQADHLPSAIYFCRLQVDGIIETRKWLKR